MKDSSLVDPSIAIEGSGDSNQMNLSCIEDMSTGSDDTYTPDQDIDMDQEEHLSDKTNDNFTKAHKDVTQDEQATAAKTSRELKSLMELNKEAKLDTNIKHKRKSMDPSQITDSSQAKAEGTSAIGKIGDRSTRSQNPEFAVKHKRFISKIAHHDDDSQASDSESEDDVEEEKAKQSVSASAAVDELAVKKTKKVILHQSCLNFTHNIFAFRMTRTSFVGDVTSLIFSFLVGLVIVPII